MDGASYDEVRSARLELHEAIERTLVQIGRQRCCRRSANRWHARANHRLNRPVTIATHGDRLAYDYLPDRRAVAAVRFGGYTFDFDQPSRGEGPLLREYPAALDGIETAVSDLWQPTVTSPGPDVDAITTARQALAQALETAVANATLDDLIAAIRSGELAYTELLFDVDEPIAQQGATELAALFERPIEAVVYQDDELALLTQISDAPADWRHAIGGWEAYVVGRDDTPTGFFVHAVDGTHLTADATVSRGDIRSAMGFDRSLAPGTDILTIGQGGPCVRLQGDLCVERTRDGTALTESLVDRYRREVERTVTAEYVHQFFRERSLESHWDAFEIGGRGTDLRARFGTFNPDGAALTAIEEALGSEAKTGPDGSDSPPPPSRYKQAATRLERRLADYIRAHQEEFEDVVEKRVSDRVEAERAAVGQLNVPIDNHFVILEGARFHPNETGPTEPVTVEVPARTSLHIIHDEHPQVDVTLPPGEYEFGLLDRGVQPPANRPAW